MFIYIFHYMFWKKGIKVKNMNIYAISILTSVFSKYSEQLKKKKENLFDFGYIFTKAEKVFA